MVGLEVIALMILIAGVGSVSLAAFVHLILEPLLDRFYDFKLW
jgi:hypothetical protein